MPPQPPLDFEFLQSLLDKARQGDTEAINQLLGAYREYIRQVVQLRLGPRIRQREDSSDLIQMTLLQAANRLADYFQREPMPFSLWIRRTAQECLADAHRRHFGSQGRNIEAEVQLPPELSFPFLKQLVGKDDPVSDAIRQEESKRLNSAVSQLDQEDREIILLRVFEQLPNAEVATILGLTPTATSKRFARALLRLRALVDARTDESPS